MRKRTQKENIAIGLVVVVAAITLPMYFGLINPPNNSSTFIGDEASQRIQSAISDIEIRDFVPGTGASAKPGDVLFVHYIGQLEDGTTFDTSVESNEPYSFRLGAGDVILGWELGLAGMREGGTRRIILPPELGYGDRNVTDANGRVIIPANSTLVFDVILLGVRDK
jgi:FKBP-type peptidyl-prolyl cis-trans isomerase